MIGCHVAPPSVVFISIGAKRSNRCRSTATYAVFTSKGDGSTVLIRAHGGTSRGVTLRQCEPSSLVTWTTPSSVPIQIVPLARGDGLIVKITPKPHCRAVAGSGLLQAASLGARWPAAPRVPLKSGLTIVQWSPSSVDRKSTCAPRYMACGATGEITSGVIHV